jgi:hypothetical protein
MNPNQRFSILTFPQFFDGQELSINIVVLPRDHNPLNPAIVPNLGITEAPAFADAELSFTANIFDGLGVFPHNFAPIPNLPLTTTDPANKRDILEALGNNFSIVNDGMINSNANLAAIPTEHKPAAPRTNEANTVKKKVPPSYLSAINNRNPGHPNAVTDDSYHCAVKDAKNVPTFEQSSDIVSWGKVFAYIMRQPLLGRQAGMIYRTSLNIDASHFPNGGWLYVDLAQDSDYREQVDTDHTFIKYYAARIPELIPNEPRQAFAPLLFPVLFKAAQADPNPAPAGNYDELFIEAAEYDDGFCKIVHCRQPPNRDLLVEENDGNHPVKEIGVQNAWDDVTILKWYIRQLLEDPTGELSGRIDAPLGVFGYNIDVRETAEPENNWESLNAVQTIQPLVLNNNSNIIELGSFEGELPYQVYPSQLGGDKSLNYWLPMYFASWNGHSMVLPDEDAALIYQTTNIDVLSDPADTSNTVIGPAQNQLNQIYTAAPINTELRYGNNYEFRVRMQDISGGSPSLDTNPINETSTDIASCRFRRFISPIQPRIQEMQPTGNDDDTIANSDEATEITQLNIRRPKLGYPAVIYTDKYADPVQRLIDQSNLGIDVDINDHNFNAEHRVGLGVADPDIDRIEITVELESLKLDKLESVSGREDYVHFYTTYRSFPEVNSDDDYEAVLNIPIEYTDSRVIHISNEVDVVNDLDLPDDIDNLNQLVLPTGRTARLTIRAVCEEKDDNEEYYGFINEGNKLLDNRFGETFQIRAYKPSENETNLLIQTPGVPQIQGIFMQPDIVNVFDGKLTTLLFGSQTNNQYSNVQQLADQLNIESNNLTLHAPKGQRVTFGCSSRIRHTLAPDHSSITFASKGDLINHWLCCISLEIDRDWMWDALKTRSFIVRRTKKYTNDTDAESTDAVVGDIELIRTVSFESLHNPQRNSTRIIFIDAVEPKKDSSGNGEEPDFPDTIDVSYSIETNFKEDHAQESDELDELTLRLPITTPPSQIPKISSAGIALSPYVRNETYSSSEPRRRHLWIEFEEPIKDPNDIYFARVLTIAPDQLLSNNNLELLGAPEEPELPIDPEFVRVVIEDATNDLAGLNAMQPMEKSTTSDRHFLIPLPPGLHAESDEMFGFFTYELRVGHFRNPDTQEMVWTTAQGRYGRRLRATGIQHPAPTLTCMPNRDEDKLWVTAPYAVAVNDGKNVTADPPRTQLWALLYAQVKQADNKDYRNILLDDRQIDWRVQIETEKEVNIIEKYTDNELEILSSIAVNNFKYEVNVANVKNVLKLVDFTTKPKDSTKFGTTVWTNNEVSQLLDIYGLPQGSPLSIVVVEILPQITNIVDHVSKLHKPVISNAIEKLVALGNVEEFRKIVHEAESLSAQKATFKRPSPVSDQLGHHRILRVSPLTEVPEIC